MPEMTPKLKLKKPYGNEAVNRVAYNENLELVDTNAASQDDFDSHKHGAILDHPNDSVTDSKIGDRTILDEMPPVSSTGLLTTLLGGLAYMVRMITGKSDWRTTPSLNLEDVRVKLGEAVPPGAIMHFARSTSPAGWLKANGATVSRAVYSNLFAVIGTTFGAGDSSTTFNLPDLRGEFIRGFDNGRGIDSLRTFGSLQTDAFQGHWHTVYLDSSGKTNPYGSNSVTRGYTNDGPTLMAYGAKDIITNETNGTPRVASETRPRNIALLPCIKY